jgi:alkanesulfonate monooxygenase SsuD/methylene tetrahydromethanopterin reductase-like flavin-dependent oxidoreductase (luciferase family)
MQANTDSGVQHEQAQSTLRQQAMRHYTALLPGGTPDEVADQIAELIDTAFGALGATRLRVRVERLEPDHGVCS